MILNDDIKSVLILDKIIVSEMSFKRSNEEIDSNELSINLENQISRIEASNNYKVDLTVIIEEKIKKSFDLKLSISGFFSFKVDDLEDEIKQLLLKKNTLSILFPYLRAQISLITSQPGMEPIVLPPININALVENENVK